MINKVIMAGEIESEPLSREAGDSAVISFKLKTWEDYKGRRFDLYHQCSMWGDRGRELLQLRRGDRIAVEGRLKTRSYTPKGSDEKRYVTEIDVRSFNVLDNGAVANTNSQPQRSDNQQTRQRAADDEIPF